MKRCALLLAFAIPFLLVPGFAAAAGQISFQELYRNETPTTNGLGLDLNVIFRDEDKHPIPLSSIQQVSFQVYPNEPIIPTHVTNATSALKIALVLDESGSMSKYRDAVRQAVQDAIGSAPNNAELAVFTFTEALQNEAAQPALPFTSDREAAKAFVQANYDPQSQGQTCLNNTLHGVLRFFQDVPATDRRAIILFSDGLNEGDRCATGSTHSDVTREATEGVITPIYTVGICPQELADGRCPDTRNFDENTLRDFADKTRALSKINTLGGLTGAFADIMDDLKAQVALRVELPVCAERSVSMLVQATNSDTQIFPVAINPQQCTTPRAEAVLAEPISSADDSVFALTIRNTSPLTMTEIIWQVVGESNNAIPQTSQPLLVAPGQTNALSVTVPLAQLASGSSTLRLYAAANGTSFQRSAGASQYSNDIYTNEPLDVLSKITWTPALAAINPMPRIQQVAWAEDGSGVMIRFVVDDLAGHEQLLEQATYAARGCNLDESPHRAAPQSGEWELHITFDPNANAATLRQNCRVSLTMIIPASADLRGHEQGYTSPISGAVDLAAPPVKAGFPWWIMALIIGVGLAAVAGVFTWQRWQSPAGVQIHNPKLPYNEHTQHPNIPTRLRLEIKASKDTSHRSPITINTFPYVIGRSKGNLTFPNDKQMSSEHLSIQHSGEGILITDLGSSNGTRLNGKPLSRGASALIIERSEVLLGTNTTLTLTPEH